MFLKMAFDKSARNIDADGRLHVETSRISKACVNLYYGKEIPGWQELGLDANKAYRLFRDPVELERGKDTFARLPILSKHVPHTVENIAEDDELKKLFIGSIGSNVRFNAPYLTADLCFWDQEAIAGIETKKIRELSCSYRYVPVMTPGNYEGEAYDGVMTEIRGNHLALVENGRAGSDVFVSDENPFKPTEVKPMKMTKLGKALYAALSAASPVFAQDSAVPALVANANRKTLKKADLMEKLLALDSEMDTAQVDNVIDALLDVEQDPEPVQTPAAAADETPADKVRNLLAGKVEDAIISEIVGLLTPSQAIDEDPEEKMSKEEVTAAMDSLRKDLREAEQARRDVSDVVGDVAMDSADEIYGFALDHMKVDRAGVEGVAALRALFNVANKQSAVATAPVVAQDSAATIKRFPNLARIRQA